MKNERLVNYVKGKKLSEYNFNNFQVFLKDDLPENIDIKNVFTSVASLMPENFLNLIDVVYVGEFSFFKEKNINAFFLDNALYISNKQDTDDDMIDDVVHEIAHAVENRYKDFIYEDETIKNEYYGKLKKLKNYLSFDGYDIRGISFFNEKYDEKFDNFLSNDIGYDKLSGYINNLFLAPYSTTSLKEFFLGNRLDLKTISPYVYKKLLLLIENNLYGDEYER